MSDQYLRDRDEFTGDIGAGTTNLLASDGTETDEAERVKRLPGSRLLGWVNARIQALVPAWARAPQPPSGQAGEAGNFERTIFNVAATRPATPTAPNTVPAGTDPDVPAGWTDGSDWAGGTPPGDTPVWASLQRVARAATAVTYTLPIRWDGMDGEDADEDVDFVADIKRRLDRQEHLTSEIGESVRTGWVESPSPGTAAIFAVLRSGDVTLTSLPRYAWATRFTVPSDSDWQVLLRLPTGRKPTSIEVTRVASDGGERPTLAGHWAYQLTEDGLTYWTWHQPDEDHPDGWHGWVDLDSGDVLTARITSTVEGTDWLGDVRALTFHEAKPWAHHRPPVT